MKQLALLFLLILTACGTDMGIGRSLKADPRAKLVDVLVATTRNATDTPVEFGAERAEKPSFASYQISIPPNHEPGVIEWPEDNRPNPSKSFATLSSEAISTQDGFIQALNQRLAAKPRKHRGVFLFVHGFNNSFAEALYSTAQIHSDYEHTFVPVHFSWASGGRAGLYAYDQDSALVARDALADLLAALLRSNATTIEVVGHSMGSLVVMEALRLLKPADMARLRKRMGNITLLSPDLDPDVFIAQIKKIEPLPQPFFLLTSRKDFVLRISSWLRGGSRRAGMGAQNFERLAEFGVTAIDITSFSNGDNFNHTLFNNPDMIDVIVDLARDVKGRRINLAALQAGQVESR